MPRSTQFGYGVASVRFICGTQTVHRELEQRLSGVPRHRGHDSVFVLLRRERRLVRDAARRAGRGHQRCAEPREHHRRHPPLQGAPAALREQRHERARALPARSPKARACGSSPPTACSRWTGTIAQARGDLRSGRHATAPSSWSTTRTRPGFIGARGRGTHELRGVMGRIDILTGTLGKALGGASGGYVAARKEIVGWLRQRVAAVPVFEQHRARRSPPAP